MSTEIVRYRTVVNDAVCWPWEDMPEVQPPTLTGLINYLRKECGINPEPLQMDASLFSNRALVRYGMRKQFELPTWPTSEELSLMEKWNAPAEGVSCPICKSMLTPNYLITAGSHESNHTLDCRKCGIAFSISDGMAWTSNQIAEKLAHAVESASQLCVPQAQDGDATRAILDHSCRVPDRAIDDLWQRAGLTTYHPDGDQLERFHDFAHFVTAEVLARIPSSALAHTSLPAKVEQQPEVEHLSTLTAVIREAINKVIMLPFSPMHEREKCLRLALVALSTIEEQAASPVQPQQAGAVSDEAILKMSWLHSIGDGPNFEVTEDGLLKFARALLAAQGAGKS